MPNGSELVDELEYKEKVKSMSVDDKLNYLLDKNYEQHVEIRELKEQCSANGFSKKGSLISSGTVTAVILGVWEAIKYSLHIGAH
jgi:hypothetical protein